MPFTLENVVPWGRMCEEYIQMFHLTADDLQLRILGCGDGPASFNSEMTKRGHSVISVDPIYQFSANQIRQRVEITRDEVLRQVRQNQDDFVWTTISSPEELERLRMTAMREFLVDFETGKQEGRYRFAELPSLPFPDSLFDLALCSHFLFLYTEQLSLEFHLTSIQEMGRVASEVRIFPLLALGGVKSRYVEPVRSALTKMGYSVDIERGDYEFQRGGNQMMRIRFD